MSRDPDTKIHSLDDVVTELAKRWGRSEESVVDEAETFIGSGVATLYFRDRPDGAWRPYWSGDRYRSGDLYTTTERHADGRIKSEFIDLPVSRQFPKIGVDDPTFSRLKRLGRFFPKLSDVAPPKPTAAAEAAFRKYLEDELRAGRFPRRKEDAIAIGEKRFHTSRNGAIRQWRAVAPESSKRAGRKKSVR
jgi:hypothetical protein